MDDIKCFAPDMFHVTRDTIKVLRIMKRKGSVKMKNVHLKEVKLKQLFYFEVKLFVNLI